MDEENTELLAQPERKALDGVCAAPLDRLRQILFPVYEAAPSDEVIDVEATVREQETLWVRQSEDRIHRPKGLKPKIIFFDEVEDVTFAQRQQGKRRAIMEQFRAAQAEQLEQRMEDLFYGH